MPRKKKNIIMPDQGGAPNIVPDTKAFKRIKFDETPDIALIRAFIDETANQIEKNVNVIVDSLKDSVHGKVENINQMTQNILNGQMEMTRQYSEVRREQQDLHIALTENIGILKEEIETARREVYENKLERQSQIKDLSARMDYFSKELGEIKGNICSTTMRKVCAIYLKRNINNDKNKMQKKTEKKERHDKLIKDIKTLPFQVKTWFWIGSVILVIILMIFILKPGSTMDFFIKLGEGILRIFHIIK